MDCFQTISGQYFGAYNGFADYPYGPFCFGLGGYDGWGYGGYDGWGYGGYDGWGYGGWPLGGCGGFGAYGPGFGAGFGPGIGPGMVPSGNFGSCGGGFTVTSASPIAPTGLMVTSENAIEGALAVIGQLPFLGAVATDGAFPTAGAGAVSYGCGDGSVAIAAEGPIAPVAGIAPIGLEYTGFGYGTGCGCGCGGIY